VDAVLDRSHFILLERQDQIAHAISRCIAWQNHRWTSEHPKSVPDAALVYSRKDIEEQLRQIEFEKGLLYRFMTEIGRAPIHFSYEAFVAQPQRHLDEIAARLGLQAMTLDRSRIRIRRQSNHINDAWRARYAAGE
jgi:LPS sulfotransferase NodH